MLILLNGWVHLLLFWVSHAFLILTPQKVSIHDIVLSDTFSWPPVWSVHSSVYYGGLTLGECNINCNRIEWIVFYAISAIYQHNNGEKRIDMPLDFRTIFMHFHVSYWEHNTDMKPEREWKKHCEINFLRYVSVSIALKNRLPLLFFFLRRKTSV